MHQLTDNSKMPFGKYQGTLLIEVPAEHLIFVYNQNPKSISKLTAYIKDNLVYLTSKAKLKK